MTRIPPIRDRKVRREYETRGQRSNNLTSSQEKIKEQLYARLDQAKPRTAVHKSRRRETWELWTYRPIGESETASPLELDWPFDHRGPRLVDRCGAASHGLTEQAEEGEGEASESIRIHLDLVVVAAYCRIHLDLVVVAAYCRLLLLYS
jgi:hypothetical protein